MEINRTKGCKDCKAYCNKKLVGVRQEGVFGTIRDCNEQSKLRNEEKITIITLVGSSNI